MTYQKHLLIALTVILVLSGCGKDEDREISKDTLGIITTGNTPLRVDPLYFSPKITHIKKGEIVTIIERSNNKNYHGKYLNYWYRIRLKNSTTGWIFGENISFMDGSDKKKVEAITEQYLEKEIARLRTELQGKWWSVNEFGDFTDHGIEIYETGTYKSFATGHKRYQGKYKIDLNNDEIQFLNGTTFNTNLSILQLGQEYFLVKKLQDYELKFKKLKRETSDEPVLPKNEAAAQ